MGLSPNPPWVDRIVNAHWDELATQVPASWMPVAAKMTRTGRRTLAEFGCGSYGCVMPTSEPGIVFKVTSDASEAAFVSAYFSIGNFNPGIIKYYKIVELHDSHFKRRTFAIWRHEAENVGEIRYDMTGRYDEKYGRGSVREFLHNISLFQRYAAAVRRYVTKSKNPAKLLVDAEAAHDRAWHDYVDGKQYTNFGIPYDIARVKIALDQLTEEMANTHAGNLVGSALSFYLEHGILLADVHLGNIGETTPEDFSSWELVITDPGHMVPLDPKWLSVEVPRLGS